MHMISVFLGGLLLLTSAAFADEKPLDPKLRLLLEQKANRDKASHQKRPVAASNTNQGGKSIRIDCPVEHLTTDVQTPLPDDWWSTPQVGELKSTRIQKIGGKATLVCRYRAYGNTVSVMRLPAQGYDRCRSIKGGFLCYR